MSVHGVQDTAMMYESFMRRLSALCTGGVDPAEVLYFCNQTNNLQLAQGYKALQIYIPSKCKKVKKKKNIEIREIVFVGVKITRPIPI